MKIVNSRKNRKAISPVLATVILIAITLIAAIAIAGFVFGLFGSFTSSAQVSAQVVGCTTTTLSSCTINLLNSGTSNANTVGSSIRFAGVTYTGNACGGVTATAGATTPATCVMTNVPVPASGSAFTGSISLSNGASVPFTGTFP
ncbi:MAG: type IV pilin [Thaumarchaeota archaeon]|nr:type IV pilin [Nitrososphaerota archaeon]